MDGFTIIDAVVALVIVVSALLAYARGLVREVLAIAGWVAATILAFIFADAVRPLIAQIPVLSDFIGDSCELSIIAAFAAVFAVALVIFSIFIPLFSGAVQRSALGAVDQAGGFLFGVARGVLLCAVAFFLYDVILSAQDIAMVEDSRSSAVFAQITGRFSVDEPQQALGWITLQYEQLVGACSGTAI
ncbi:CvpA family protein [Pseudoroseicyclus aestuarii]|uniref:Membrane protein required for colicin V production n=1 Tax=Pseudoroseicyclus aestuarii TaxID=1795041 RepID=A0A318SWG3_9RHOB|nr:CvpA family protein [Pseudoroseicyclus aestuarii]PYE85842.1 membrane protein required for colicin V production [Pseudoroseicyclus aestuarii]